MMSKKTSSEIMFFIILCLLLIISIVLLFVIDQTEATRIELSLIYLIQFVSTIGITYLISRDSLKREFEDSNKNFARSSYRRIVDIKDSLSLIENVVDGVGKSLFGKC